MTVKKIAALLLAAALMLTVTACGEKPAAMNNRQRKLGYNAAQEFSEQIDRHFEMSAGRK